MVGHQPLGLVGIVALDRFEDATMLEIPRESSIVPVVIRCFRVRIRCRKLNALTVDSHRRSTALPHADSSSLWNRAEAEQQQFGGALRIGRTGLHRCSQLLAVFIGLGEVTGRAETATGEALVAAKRTASDRRLASINANS